MAAITTVAAKKPVILAPIHANAGIEAAYRVKLNKLIAEMARSYEYWIAVQWNRKPPATTLAHDSNTEDGPDPKPWWSEMSSVKGMAAQMARLGTYWEAKFSEAAPKLAEYFSRTVANRSETVLKDILRQGGIGIDYRMTAGAKAVMQSTTAENVSLIKSIQTEYHQQVNGAVMRAVQRGNDLTSLQAELKERYPITKRRAELIARDQCSKATAAINEQRQTEAGIVYGYWQHSGGARHPRRHHVAVHGKLFKIAEGLQLRDPGPNGKLRWVKPGKDVNCNCTWRPIIPRRGAAGNMIVPPAEDAGMRARLARQREMGGMGIMPDKSDNTPPRARRTKSKSR